MRQVPIFVIALLGLAGCGGASVPDDDAAPTTRASVPPTTIAAPTTVPAPTSSTVPVTAAPSPAPAPTTSRVTTATTVRAAATTTTRPLTRAEATSKLCAAVKSADDAIQQGRLVAGGLRLSSALGAYSKTADPAVATAARQALSAGVNGDPEGYLAARSAASTACARAGFPIVFSGPIQCIQAPCP